ncbi:putative LOV domain-containing protein [Tanacetum coccineum]
MILMKMKQGWKNVLKAASKHLPSAEKDLGNTVVLNDAGWLHSSVARERFHDDRYDCLFRQSGSVETRGVKKIEHHNQRMQTNSETAQCIIRKDKLLLVIRLSPEIAKNAIVAEAGAFKETYVIYRALISEVNHNDVIQTAELVSLPAKQLIYRLLHRDPQNRLDSHEDATELKLSILSKYQLSFISLSGNALEICSVICSVGKGVGGLMNSNLQHDEVGDGTTSMEIWPHKLLREAEKLLAMKSSHSAAARSAWERLFSRYHRICLLSAGVAPPGVQTLYWK